MSGLPTDSPQPPGFSAPGSIALTGDQPWVPVGLFRSSPLGQALGAYVPATGLIRFINFARVILLTWWMTTHQFGLLSMILLVINVLTPLCSLGLSEAITRYVPQYEVSGSLLAFVRRSFLLVLAVSAVSVVLVMLFAPQLGGVFFAKEVSREGSLDLLAYVPRLTRLTAAVTALQIVYFYLASVLKGLRMFVALAIIETVHSLLFLAGSIAAWLTGHLSAFTIMVIYGASLALPIVCFGLGFSRVLARWTAQHGPGASDDLPAKLLRFSIWTTLAGLTWQILIYYPVWYLFRQHGEDAVAVFNAVRQIGQLIMLGAVAVSTVVMTTVIKTWESQGRDAAGRQLSLAFRCTGFGLLLLCAVLALAKDLIILMYRPAYAPGAAILPLQFLFFLIGAYLAFLPIHFQLIELTRHIFWSWAIGVASNAFLAYWLAGPGLEKIHDSAAWNWLGPPASAIFIAGFSDPLGLGGASWCGAIAIGIALFMCIVLIRAAHCHLDRGSYIVIAAAPLVCMRPWVLTLGTVLLLVLAWRTNQIFTPGERGKMSDYARAALRRLRGINRSPETGGDIR